MRLSAIAVLLFFSILAVLVYYAIKQEMLLQKARSRLRVIVEEVQMAENARAQAKETIQELSGPLSSAADKTNELTQAKNDELKAEREILSYLQTCNIHKAAIMKSKTAADENLKKVTADQEKEKKAAEQEIRRLKGQISERDKKLCQFVHSKTEESRKLCGNAQGPR